MYVKRRAPRRKVHNVMRNTRRPKQDTVVVMRASKGAGGFVGGYYDRAQWYAPNISYKLHMNNFFICCILYVHLHFHLLKEAYPSKNNRFGRRRRGEKMYVL